MFEGMLGCQNGMSCYAGIPAGMPDLRSPKTNLFQAILCEMGFSDSRITTYKVIGLIHHNK